MRPARKAKPDRYTRDVWDRNDVASHFGCSLPHVLKLMHAQGLPYSKLGTLIRFRKEDVLTWHAAQTTKEVAV